MSLGSQERELHSLQGWPTVVERGHPGDTALYPGPSSHTFSDTDVYNLLKLQVRFEAKDSYGGMAGYRIEIQPFNSSSNLWDTPIVWDPVWFCTPTGDHDTWYYYEREYTLPMGLSIREVQQKKFVKRRFRINGYIWVGKNVVPGGQYGNPHSFELTAVLTPPKLNLVKQQLAELQRRTAYYMQQEIERLPD